MIPVDLSKSDFIHKLAGAKRGQWIMYHLGYLYEDRTKNRKLNALAHAVYDEGQLGKCALVQRRLGPGRYEYYAVKL
jgi:hypothetical protein